MHTVPFLLVGGLALLNLGLISLWLVHHARLLRGEPGLFAPRWSLLDVWFGFQLTGISLMVLSGLLLGLFMPRFHLSDPSDSVGTMLSSSGGAWVLMVGIVLLQEGAMVGLSWGLVRWRFKESWAAIGLRGLPTGREAVQGLIAGSVMILFLLLVQLALSLMSQSLVGESWLHRITREDRSSRVIAEVVRGLDFSAVVIGGLFLFAVVIAPFCEELLFRGVLYNALKRRFGHGWAAPVSGAIFALVHASTLGFIPRWVIGWLLANMYHRSGSLWVPVIAHAMNNALAFFMLLRLSQRV